MNVLHNMSCPPRTNAVMQGRPVSPQVTVFSLPYALTESGLVDLKLAAGGHLYLSKLLEGTRWIAKRVRARWKTPEDLFADVGTPRFLEAKVDFLIGWRLVREHLALRPVFCLDPCLCAGVQARCAGPLYLSRRTPDLTWERLLDAPVAFDDPLVSLP